METRLRKNEYKIKYKGKEKEKRLFQLNFKTKSGEAGNKFLVGYAVNT
jgi:hypothetical protein